MAYKSRFGFVVGLLVLFSLAAAPTQADPIIDFGTGSAFGLGTVGYTGGSAPLVGTNIGIGLVGGLGTPLNSGGYAVTGTNSGYGSLNFTTGAYQSYSSGVYTFGSGGTFTITGAVVAAGITSVTNLLTGTFTSATLTTFGTQGFLQVAGLDTKNPALLAFFGIPAGTGFTFLGWDLSSGNYGAGGGAFTATAFSSDISNTPVPEPASLLLLGSGLTALGAYIRRRNLKRKAKQALTRLS